METTYIEHNGKQYEVKEPTINTWKNVMIFKDLLDEEEMSVKMIAEVTGLSVKEVKEADALEIRIAGDKLWRYLNQESKQLHTTIEHNGTTYELVDVNKISFGQFVDIDSFMKKDESYKIANLNELAAYLYCEQGVKYGDSDIKKRIEDFKDLKVKYIESAVFFLLNLGKGLHELTLLYSKSKTMWWLMRTRIALASFGDGMQRLLSSQKTKFGKLIVLLTFPLWLVSIIFLFLWMLITRRKNK
jgi:hemin uptake protein HemP